MTWIFQTINRLTYILVQEQTCLPVCNIVFTKKCYVTEFQISELPIKKTIDDLCFKSLLVAFVFFFFVFFFLPYGQNKSCFINPVLLWLFLSPLLCNGWRTWDLQLIIKLLSGSINLRAAKNKTKYLENLASGTWLPTFLKKT